MAINAHWYGQHFVGQYSSTAARRIDWDVDTIKCALTTVTYTPDLDAHDFFSDITNEVSGTGYTAGGVALTTSAPTYDAATNEMRLDATDAQWTSASFTARYAVVYKDTGTPATSPLVCYLDMDANQTVSSGTFTITWDSTGIAKVTVA